MAGSECWGAYTPTQIVIPSLGIQTLTFPLANCATIRIQPHPLLSAHCTLRIVHIACHALSSSDHLASNEQLKREDYQNLRFFFLCASYTDWTCSLLLSACVNGSLTANTTLTVAREEAMFAESLHFLRELPSPEGTWELVEVIGEWKGGRFVSLVAVACSDGVMVGRGHL